MKGYEFRVINRFGSENEFAVLRPCLEAARDGRPDVMENILRVVQDLLSGTPLPVSEPFLILTGLVLRGHSE